MLAQPHDPNRPAAPKSALKPARKPPRKRRIGLAPRDEERLKKKLRRRTPSEPWVEAQIRTASDTAEDGSPLTYRYHDPHVFPPGGAKTAMIRCPVCGVFTPPNVMENGQCPDHSESDIWGPSPSAVAIRALQYFHLCMESRQLKPEDTAALSREIDRFYAKNRKNVRAAPNSCNDKR